jgi:hypothetical protein
MDDCEQHKISLVSSRTTELLPSHRNPLFFCEVPSLYSMQEAANFTQQAMCRKLLTHNDRADD